MKGETGRPLDDRLSDLVKVWYDLHGCTLKDGKQRLARCVALAKRLGNPLAFEFDSLAWARYRQRRLTEVKPETVNHEQRYLSAVFSELIRLGSWHKETRWARSGKSRRIRSNLRFCPWIRSLDCWKSARPVRTTIPIRSRCCVSPREPAGKRRKA